MADNNSIRCENMWKIFGPHPQRVLSQLTPDKTRAQVQAENGHVIAVKDVSFAINQGETFVVMGLSGSGKSTLVRCLCRLIEPTAGNFYIGDKNVTTMSNAKLMNYRGYATTCRLSSRPSRGP